jgi:NAD(P)-dependent dehydrogenase (short-subunit alcohol dehydrogenase family)
MAGGDLGKALTGKLAIVTGGSSGIGQYTALGLAQMGAAVVIMARNPARLTETAAWLRTQVPGADIQAETVDFAQLDSVRAAAGRILERHPKIDILVNNAGLVMGGRSTSVDGFETLFQINHLGPFLLTNLLLPAVKAAAPSRIVVVASNAAKSARIDFDDLQLAQDWGPMKAYGRSKLMNILFTYALARRLGGSGVTANCLHPGFVASRIGAKGGVYDLIWAMIKPFALSPAKGARTSLYAAADRGMAGVTGKYLIDCAPARSNDLSYDIAAQDRLWINSARMAGLPPD